jgi:D-sedoheptulose 7-phosphate isomerase
VSFEESSPVDLTHAALELARLFSEGRRLVVTAPGRQDHARHVAVEFVHPAITGARSLPAVAVPADLLHTQVQPEDLLLIIEPFGADAQTETPEANLILRVGLGLGGQELVRWYHLLWELVQLGLEHPGLTGGKASAGGDSTNFLYPFLDAAEADENSLIESMVSSAEAKHVESQQLASATAVTNSDTILAASAEIARRSADERGRVFAIGNGGSSTDAARLVRKLSGVGVQATCLAEDPAIITALANDLGVSQIFARQVEAFVKPQDVLIAFSTSGASPNLLAAFDTQAARDALVIACAGYNGGPMAAHAYVDHQLTTDSSSVHRIQESQAALIDQLCQLVHEAQVARHQTKTQTGAPA